jgi:hypothetical protein
MKTEWLKTIYALRDAGYLVIIWSPEELGDIDASHVEDALIERGNNLIEQLMGQPPRGEQA